MDKDSGHCLFIFRGCCKSQPFESVLSGDAGKISIIQLFGRRCCQLILYPLERDDGVGVGYF